jgi:predicted DNA-binding protein
LVEHQSPKLSAMGSSPVTSAIFTKGFFNQFLFIKNTNLMIILTLNLPKKVEQELEKDLKYLEETTKKPREYHIKEALIRYMEDMEDIQTIEEHIKNKDKAKYYTSEELKKKLNLE